MEKQQDPYLDHRSVLIVEDEPLVRSSVAEALRDVGYRVFEACHAQDALAILYESHNIQIVTTDIDMPGDTDGLALAAMIRVRWPDTIILINSGRVRPETDALPVGASFIAKPFSVTQLLRQLKILLEQRGVLVISDEDILATWHESQLTHNRADRADRLSTLARVAAAEQMAIERFGLGAHGAAYDMRFPDKPCRPDSGVAGLPATKPLPPGVVSPSADRAP